MFTEKVTYITKVYNITISVRGGGYTLGGLFNFINDNCVRFCWQKVGTCAMCVCADFG